MNSHTESSDTDVRSAAQLGSESIDLDAKNGDRAYAPREANKGPEEQQRMSVTQIIGSVFAAGLGVQSSKNRERDFQQGRPGVFIAAGLIFTLLFLGTVYGIVSLVLSSR